MITFLKGDNPGVGKDTVAYMLEYLFHTNDNIDSPQFNIFKFGDYLKFLTVKRYPNLSIEDVYYRKDIMIDGKYVRECIIETSHYYKDNYGLRFFVQPYQYYLIQNNDQDLFTVFADTRFEYEVKLFLKRPFIDNGVSLIKIKRDQIENKYIDVTVERDPWFNTIDPNVDYYTINNNSTLEQLLTKVQHVLGLMDYELNASISGFQHKDEIVEAEKRLKQVGLWNNI